MMNDYLRQKLANIPEGEPDAADLAMIVQAQADMLRAAIADIPHVGNFCAHMDKRGYCTLNNQVCCRKVHTPCETWKWRGETE